MSQRRGFKFEDLADVGQRIRSHDFNRRTNSYIEGEVTLKDVLGESNGNGFACYVVACDRECWEGQVSTEGGRVGMTIYVPMEIHGMDWAGRVVNLSDPNRR